MLPLISVELLMGFYIAVRSINQAGHSSFLSQLSAKVGFVNFAALYIHHSQRPFLFVDDGRQQVADLMKHFD